MAFKIVSPHSNSGVEAVPIDSASVVCGNFGSDIASRSNGADNSSMAVANTLFQSPLPFVRKIATKTASPTSFDLSRVYSQSVGIVHGDLDAFPSNLPMKNAF